MKTLGKLSVCLLVAVAALMSCTTLNRLDMYDLRGASVAANLRVPPEPTFDTRYDVQFDRQSPIGSVLSIGSNIAMASEAYRAETRMRDALRVIDVPEVVLDESFAACVDALGAQRVYLTYQADYLLDIEILEYGIKANAPNGAVSMIMRVEARLYHNRSGEVVWRRRVSVDQPAAPYMFGLPDILGNVVTGTALSRLSTQEMATGFEHLAVESSRLLARRLEDDLFTARYR